MDDAFCLGSGPLQTLACAIHAKHRRAKVLPACKAIFTGEHKLGISQR